MEEFENDVPESTWLAIGYYEGQTKRWICSDDDLSMLYEVHAKYPDKEILLWCEGREKDCDQTSSKAKRKKTTNDGGSKSKREEKEDRVKLIAEELQTMHKDKLDLNEVQYRLWSRMIISGIHCSKEIPPQVTGINSQKKPKSNLFEETMMNTATAVMKAITNNQDSGITRSTQIQKNISNSTGTPIATCVSPGKAVDVRGKSLGQLATLKQLFIDGVLSQEEFNEQKEIILGSLKKLK